MCSTRKVAGPGDVSLSSRSHHRVEDDQAMADAVIDNPILNSPFDEPERHWKFERDGITNEVVDGRRVSSYFMPIPKSKRGGDQLQFETEWTSDRIRRTRRSTESASELVSGVMADGRA